MAKGTRYTPEFKAVEQVARDPGRRRRCAVGATRRTPWPGLGTARRTPGRRSGAGLGRDQVTNVMRESGIRGVRRVRTPATTNPAKGTGGGPDLVERRFDVFCQIEVVQNSELVKLFVFGVCFINRVPFVRGMRPRVGRGPVSSWSLCAPR